MANDSAETKAPTCQFADLSIRQGKVLGAGISEVGCKRSCCDPAIGRRRTAAARNDAVRAIPPGCLDRFKRDAQRVSCADYRQGVKAAASANGLAADAGVVQAAIAVQCEHGGARGRRCVGSNRQLRRS
ncbi:MAG: hypothetical protein MJA27_19785 [Pseudanabaenales cyanobacterium]|nr:hypothetical protein [Pseudanabaenales cyanobacterium]